MSDRQIDSTTGDLVSGPNGGWADVDVLENKIMFSYAIARGSWEGDRELGHRFAELARATDSIETRNRLRDLVVDGVQWLLDSGELVRVVVTVLEYQRGALAWQAEHFPPTGKSIKTGVQLTPIGAG